MPAMRQSDALTSKKNKNAARFFMRAGFAAWIRPAKRLWWCLHGTSWSQTLVRRPPTDQVGWSRAINNTDVDEVRETYLQLAQFWLDMRRQGLQRQAAEAIAER
jgi:hypothetical protein